jgi:hypothetical protein
MRSLRANGWILGMNVELFYSKIKNTVQEYNLADTTAYPSCITLIKFIDEVLENKNSNITLKMTQMTILFEGFYRSLLDNSSLKKRLTSVRINRWANHYGTPTITFLITYHSEIERTHLFFQTAASCIMSVKPWEIINKSNLVVDPQNEIVVDVQTTDSVDMPKEDEKTGQFLKTHNPSGGFTTTPCDLVSQKFLEYTSNIAKQNGKVLEIGAAFGAASLQALEQGTTVFCNDTDPNNLAVVKKRSYKKNNNYLNSVTGDSINLILVPGSFPDELNGLPKGFFDAILICRVMHFFTGEQIEKSLEQLLIHLKSGGKLFVVCETPFLKNWQHFIPEYEKRVSKKIKWPGEIINPTKYENSGRAASLPKFVHWITKEILERSLKQAKFRVEYLSYMNRHGQFPNDLLLDGRESVGAVAVKP